MTLHVNSFCVLGGVCACTCVCPRWLSICFQRGETWPCIWSVHVAARVFWDKAVWRASLNIWRVFITALRGSVTQLWIFFFLLLSCLGLWIRRPENWKHFCLLFCCCFSFLNIWFFAVSLWFLLNKCFFYIYNNKQKFSFLRWISDTLYFYSVTLVEWLSLIHSWFIDSCHRSRPCCSSSVHPLSEPSCSSSLPSLSKPPFLWTASSCKTGPLCIHWSL